MPSTPESEETRVTDAEVEAAAKAIHKTWCPLPECQEPTGQNPRDQRAARAALEAAAALHQPPTDAEERCEDYDNDVTAVYHALSLPRCKNAAAQTVDGRRVCFTHARLADLAAALHPPREGAGGEKIARYREALQRIAAREFHASYHVRHRYGGTGPIVCAEDCPPCLAKAALSKEAENG